MTSECYALSLEVIFFSLLHTERLSPLLQTGSRFNRSGALLVLLVPDPQEIKERVALRWPLCISTHQNHSRQVARVQDDKKTIPSFISQLLSHTPLQPENRPEKSTEKRFESLCTKVTRTHKVQLLFVWRESVHRGPQRTQMFPLLIKQNKINCTHQAND